MRTEATPTSNADVIMDPVSAEHKGRFLPAISACAQIVPKICQEYQNVSKDIEIHRNAGDHKNGPFAVEVNYFLYLSFFRRFLHTVKGRAFGSPLAPASYPRASTAEVDPRALPSSGAKRMRAGKTGAPAAVEVRGSSHLSPTRLPLRAPLLLRSPLAA